MKLKPYKELIKLSKEKVDEALAPIRARTVKAKADLKMAELEAQILEKQTKLQEVCVEKDVNLDKIVTLSDEIALLERKQKQYGQIFKQLFPE